MKILDFVRPELVVARQAKAIRRGKVLIDCTNPLALNGDGSLSLSLGSTTSGAEEVENLLLLVLRHLPSPGITG